MVATYIYVQHLFLFNRIGMKIVLVQCSISNTLRAISVHKEETPDLKLVRIIQSIEA